MGHFSPDCTFYSRANSTCPTRTGAKRKGHATEEDLQDFADPLTGSHKVFQEVMKPFAYTLENPATGRLVGRKVSGRVSSRCLLLYLRLSVHQMYQSFQFESLLISSIQFFLIFIISCFLHHRPVGGGYSLFLLCS